MELRVEPFTIYCVLNEKDEIVKECDTHEEAEQWKEELQEIYEDK